MRDGKLTVAFGVLGSVLHLDEANVNRANGSSQYPPVLKLLLSSPIIEHVVLHCRVSDKSLPYLKNRCQKSKEKQNQEHRIWN